MTCATPGNAMHPAKHDFLVVTRAPEHPVMKGLPAEWLQPSDEIYSQLRGPAKNLQILATASADPATMKNGTGENEPMFMTIQYGKGRVFHDTLAHVGPKDVAPVPSLNTVGFGPRPPGDARVPAAAGVRRTFADTAYWNPAAVTQGGKASIESTSAVRETNSPMRDAPAS